MRIDGILAAALIGSLAVGLCACDAQTSGDGKEQVLVANVKSVDESGGEITVDGGVGVVIQPGTVALGTDVSVETVVAPAEFAGAPAIAASDAIAILATDVNGLPVDTVTVPMTVNLIIDDSAALALQATPAVENLCVLLKTRTAALFVWRRSLITVDESTRTAKIATTRFGTFQLVYCGETELPGFTDAAIGGVIGEARAALTMKLQAGYMQERGHDKVCALTARGIDDNKAGGDKDKAVTVLAAASAAAGVAAALDLGVPKSQILTAEGYEYFVAVFMMAAGSPCPAVAGENLGLKGRKLGDVRAALIFEFTAAQVAEGTIAGLLGEAGLFATKTTKVALGVPGDGASTGPAHFEPQVCLGSASDKGQAMIAVDFSADGRIGGFLVYDVPAVVGTGNGVQGVVATVGQGCVSFGALAPNIATGKPYDIYGPAGGNDASYLTPITLRINNSRPQILTGNGCLRVRGASGNAGSGSTGVPGSDSSDRRDYGQVTLSLSVRSFPLYLPYAETYDMEVEHVGTGTCEEPANSSIPPVPLPGKPLTANITIDL